MKNDIAVISNLEGVGQNLWDQILFPVVHVVDLPTAAQLITGPQFAAETRQQYVDRATGPLSSLNGFISRGNVTLGTADVADPPIINLGWLTDPDDVDAQVAVAAIKRIRQAWSTITDITIGPEVAPGPNVESDADILSYIRNAATTIYHAAGTCAMGKRGDRYAVADSSARMFGVSGLRVVDNSVVPFTVPGHPQSTVYMLAEKVADLMQNGG